MILILIALLAVVIMSCVVFLLSDCKGGFFSEVLCPFIAVIGFCGLILYSAGGYQWIASETKAEIINREYGTKYTQKEVFYASDVIETIRELKRTRIEVNGDLMKSERELKQREGE